MDHPPADFGCGWVGAPHLLSNCEHRKPDHESQLRPLTALPPEQAQLAWESAVQEAGGRRITAARVKAAIKQLGLAPATPPVSKITRRKKAEQRRQLDEAIGQLLVLIKPKSELEVLRKGRRRFCSKEIRPDGCQSILLVKR